MSAELGGHCFALLVLLALPGAMVCDNMVRCRDRGGYLPPDIFTTHACTSCFTYLFFTNKALAPSPRYGGGLNVLPENRTHGVIQDTIMPSPANQSSMDAVCSALNGEECRRWTDCCLAAVQCCHDQVQAVQAVQANLTTSSPGHCPMTWDGYGCWLQHSAGQAAFQQCPSFLPLSLSTRDAVKTCTENGTWLVKSYPGGRNMEWTDYTSCLDKNSYLVGVNICISINVVSVCFIVPAICIFIYFRDLFRQNRVRIHIHLLVALGLCCLVTTLWYALVHRDLFTTDNRANTVISQNPIWCQIMAVVKLYLSSATYWWMLCEGVYLHRLLVNAFHPPKSLIGFCVLGWGCPAVCVLIYACIRGPQNHDSCWAHNYGYVEWIIYAPNLFCLVANLFILFNILRILLCQIHGHPHEPSNFRRGLKAAFMLIPLFGLQLLLTLYRPKLGHAWEREYESFTYVVTNSQGIFVSIIFCYLNGEVLAHFRRLCPCDCLGHSHKWGAQHSVVNTTQFTLATEDPRGSPPDSPTKAENLNDSYSNHEKIKLQPVSNNYTQLIATTTENGKEKGRYQAIPAMV